MLSCLGHIENVLSGTQMQRDELYQYASPRTEVRKPFYTIADKQD